MSLTNKLDKLIIVKLNQTMNELNKLEKDYEAETLNVSYIHNKLINLG